MKRKRHHILFSLALPVLFFINYGIPGEVLGCRTRGLAALVIALLSLAGAFGAAAAGLRARYRGDADVLWWVLNSLILAIPAVALMILA